MIISTLLRDVEEPKPSKYQGFSGFITPSIPKFSLALFEDSRRNRRSQQKFSQPLIEDSPRRSTRLTSKLLAIT
ncbi:MULTISPECIES: hypothetical protein [unclassified Microcoleus]|uniref:hypothetical protein n=1 Tax=unclassified Microcoleus TaxID=2642155 RepID=UPI002FD1FB8A